MHTNGVGGPSDRPLPQNARGKSKNNIAWVDVETDSLDASTGHLLEIAVVVTDAELNILDEEGLHAVVAYTASQVADMWRAADDFVSDMHDKTGLWEKTMGPEAVPLDLIDGDLREYIGQFGLPGTMPVAGNSVRLDMNFMDKHLPLTAGYLDYHMRDVSTVAGLASDWYDLPWFEKKSDNTAKLDIRESIRELKHYREAIFRTPDEHLIWSKGAAFHRRALAAEQLLAEVREMVAKAEADWPKVEHDEQYVALGSFLSDLGEVLK